MQQARSATATANDRDVRRHHSLRLALFVALAATWLLFVGVARAQDYQFSSIQVEGNQRVESGNIIRFSGIARVRPCRPVR